MNKPANEIATHSQPHCRCCGSEGTILYKGLKDRLFGAAGEWDLKQCTNNSCQLVWLDPMPNADEIYKAYLDYYTRAEFKSSILPGIRLLENGYLALRYGYKTGASAVGKLLGGLLYLFPTERAEADFYVLELDASERGRLLDIGCGNGHLISRLQKYGWQVEGIDFDEQAVAYCQSKGLNVKVGDLQSQQYPDDTFDILTLNHVIEHISDTEALLSECFRILKKGGSLVIATPNTKSMLHEGHFGRNWLSLDPPRHLYLFNLDNLTTFARRAGFAITVAKTIIRNEFGVYLGSNSIARKGTFAMGKGGHSKIDHVMGRAYQLWEWFRLFFEKDKGGELFLKITKPHR